MMVLQIGKGDPPGTSASAKDREREKRQDALIKDPPKLPEWLGYHERKASRVDVDVGTSDLCRRA
jgi:cell cycle checkpoint protein